MAFNELDVLKKLIRVYRTTKTCKVIVKKCKKVGKDKEGKWEEFHNPHLKCLEAIEDLQTIPEGEQ
jgi:hypothetical protein